ncbi:metallophosphoesterase [Marinilongibacter aquaticus]|uniref:sugar-binding protein n=1 Tax=Marinilongibacter aquaticus TaxID=2975157 RepID=UPI0021BDCE75|nr:sugar-binding protein [Marinilongibacter aquaticus]UBM59339.1 metallophosphoesterase [Marinilongibacter aquaticus]
MNKLLSILAIILFNCSLYAQKPSIQIESIEGPKPYTSLDLNNNPENFQFAIVTDRTGGHRAGVFLDGIQKLNLLQPEFVMSVGDFIEGYTKDQEVLNTQWTEFNGFIDSLQMPFFYVPGNHDITNEVMEEKWKELFGQTFYHFVYQDVLFMCLNSEDSYRGSGRGTIGDEQYEYIKKALEENKDVKWTMLFLHQPLWVQEADNKRWADVEALLKGRKHTVFAGHRHNYVKYDRNDSKYFILATTGGGSPLRGPRLGEFDHVVWVTMTEQGPIVANLALSGIWDENVNTEAMNDYFKPLINGQAIQVKPLYAPQGTFDSGKTEIRLSNDSNAPMQALLEFEGNTGILADFYTKTIEVAPNSVEIIPVSLSRNPNFTGELNPLKLRSELTYTLPNEEPSITKKTNYSLLPAHKQSFAPMAKVSIDGKLNDWKNLRFSNNDTHMDSTPFSHKNGNADGAFQFDTRYDKDFLYVAVKVDDDELELKDGARPRNQDGIQLFIDPRPEAISATNTSLSDVLYLELSPNSDLTKLPEGITAACVKAESGFNAEFRIPLSSLNKLQGGEWKSVRLNVAVTDFDADFSHKTVLRWQPDWRSEATFSGSGIFEK